MKAITTKAYITTISSRKDRSLRLSVVTPELTTEQRAEFMNLQNVNLDLLLSPLDEPDAPPLKVAKDVRQKSQTQRLYNVLYVLWKQEGEQGNFDAWRWNEMEKFINIVKDNLE